MKVSVLVSVLALAGVILMLPLAASAQIPMLPGSLEISATGGMSIPFGDFNEFAEPGYGIGAQGAMYVMPNLAIGASMIYNSYGINAAFDDPLADISLSIWEFAANGKYLFMPGPVSPYAKASLGMFRSKASAFGVSSSVNDIGIGGGIGAQMRLPASNIGFFAEGIATSVFTDGGSTNYYSIRGGINLYVSP